MLARTSEWMQSTQADAHILALGNYSKAEWAALDQARAMAVAYVRKGAACNAL